MCYRNYTDVYTIDVYVYCTDFNVCTVIPYSKSMSYVVTAGSVFEFSDYKMDTFTSYIDIERTLQSASNS
jgi:hypothetical protein